MENDGINVLHCYYFAQNNTKYYEKRCEIHHPYVDQPDKKDKVSDLIIFFVKIIWTLMVTHKYMDLILNKIDNKKCW